ncbi:MAG: plastocyanin/azurin family copper-binding protein [Chloroflexi bacterium]|nr:plastocyanin/azurin family copper-binding protein [Chloroflexota bacterium]
MDKGYTRREFLRSSMLIGGLGIASIFLAACGGAGGGAAAATAVPSGPPVTFDLSSGDSIEFSNNKLEAAAGSKITVNLTNKSANSTFNWVLAKPGKMLAVVTNASTETDANGYLKPNDANVIAHTELVKPGQKGSVTFDAPPPGEYQFFCTVPGYYTRMNGTLTIK